MAIATIALGAALFGVAGCGDGGDSGLSEEELLSYLNSAPLQTSPEIASCTTATENGVGEWECETSSGEGSLTVTIDDGGGVTSRGVGVSVVGGCCIDLDGAKAELEETPALPPARPANEASLRGNAYGAVDSRGNTATIIFANGRFRADGCNSFQGRYRVKKGMLIVSRHGSTTALCTLPGAMRADRAFDRLFAKGARATLRGETLTLSSDDGTSLELNQEEFRKMSSGESSPE